MASVQESIEVDVPVRSAYNQWTQFEEFPRFMEGVEEVSQIDDTHLRWRAKVGGKEKEWTAEITEQRPDERVAWKNVEGADNAGVVTFHRIGDGRAEVTAQIDAEPEGVVETAGDPPGRPPRRRDHRLLLQRLLWQPGIRRRGLWRARRQRLAQPHTHRQRGHWGYWRSRLGRARLAPTRLPSASFTSWSRSGG